MEKLIWVKNLRTGQNWEVSEARASDLMRETDSQGVVYARTDAPEAESVSDDADSEARRAADAAIAQAADASRTLADTNAKYDMLSKQFEAMKQTGGKELAAAKTKLKAAEEERDQLRLALEKKNDHIAQLDQRIVDLTKPADEQPQPGVGT